MNTRLLFLGAATLTLFASACLPMFQVAPTAADHQAALDQARADAQTRTDAAVVEQLQKAREKAEKGGPREAIAFASSVRNAYLSGAVERGAVDGPTHVEEARSDLARAVEDSPEEKTQLLAAEGNLLVAAGQTDEAEVVLRESMKARPTLAALMPLAALLDEAGGNKDEIISLCKATLKEVDTDDERYDVLFLSIQHTHAASVEGGLAWTSSDNRAFFKEEKARRDEAARISNEKHRAEQEARTAKMHADFAESNKRHDEERRCKSRCEADVAACKSQCGTNGPCVGSCMESGQHCHRSCR